MSHITIYEAAIMGPFYAFVVMAVYYPLLAVLPDVEWRHRDNALMVLAMIVATFVVWWVANGYRGDPAPFEEGIVTQPGYEYEP
ncbi:hypothetical protein [Roseovarius sp. TE539]|uniref:hypothetical protein n=1 Tax=Roseovarius sp. TE539 TaxID=2249812 RepID=UPI0011BE3CD2|nr:hypothetical protein [Roseovarius sp. TE539]